MDKFKFGLFDIFTYTLPGLVIMFSIFLCYHDINNYLISTVKNIYPLLNQLSFPSYVCIFILSYIIGFILHPFGYKYFHYIGKSIWAKMIKEKMKSPVKGDYELVLARHYSKENFIYVEQWYAFRGMSFNLSLAFLCLTVILVYKVVSNSILQMDWYVLIIICFFSSISLLRRAVKFHIWSHNTLFETAKILYKDGVTQINENAQ